MKIIKIKTCNDCPYKRIWYGDFPEPNDFVCANYLYTVITNINIFPEWCPLKEE